MRHLLLTEPGQTINGLWLLTFIVFVVCLVVIYKALETYEITTTSPKRYDEKGGEVYTEARSVIRGDASPSLLIYGIDCDWKEAAHDE